MAQATALIMGANIGTTITAQIAALSAFPITTYLELLSFIGIMIAMLCQKDRTKKVGYIIAGLGLVFIGLKIMSDAMQTNRETLQGIFEVVTNPFFYCLLEYLLLQLFNLVLPQLQLLLQCQLRDLQLEQEETKFYT